MRDTWRKRSWLVVVATTFVVVGLAGGCNGLSARKSVSPNDTVAAAEATIEAQRQQIADALAASDQLTADQPGGVSGVLEPAGQETDPAGEASSPPTGLQAPGVVGIRPPTDLEVRAASGMPAPGSQPPGSPAPIPTPSGLDRTENILVLGTDLRPNDTIWRTDSIMVVAIDHSAGQVGIISVPRDLYVSIPGYGKERINAADYIGEKSKYPGGGPALVRRTLEMATGIPTQHYVRIKQDGLTKLVDALGGVTVNLACPLYEMAPEPRAPGGYQKLMLPAGPVRLDGATAKKFATYRYIETNFGRERRQQQLIWAIRNRVMEGDMLGRVPELWSALADVFTTDLSLPQVIQLAGLGVSLKSANVHSMSITPDLLTDYTTSQGAMVVLLRSQAALKARLATLFAAKPVADVGVPDKGVCPAPPRGFPNLNATPTPGK